MRLPLLLTAFALLGTMGISRAQTETVILDFEDAATTTTFQSFGGAVEGNVNSAIENPDKTGVNTSDSVMIHVKPSDAPEWGGAFSNPIPATPVDLTTAGSMISIKVWMPVAGPVRLKLEESTTGAGNWEVDMTPSAAGEWVELMYDPTTPSAAGDGVVAAGNSYNKVVVFFNFGTPGNGTDDVTYYFDDVVVTSPPPPPGGDVVILDFEDATTTTTFQSFGGAVEGNVNSPIENPDKTGINTSDSVMIHVKPSDAPEWGGAFSNPIPTNPVDLTASGSMISMKVWMPVAGPVRLKLEESTTGAGNWEVDLTPSAAGEWVELVYDPTTPSAAGDGVVAAGNSYNKVVVFFNFGTPGNGTDDVTYYFDDVVVLSSTTSINDELVDNLFSVAPNPTRDFVTLSLTDSPAQPTDVVVTDMQGRTVYSSTLDRGVASHELSVQGWTAGMYIVQLRTGNQFGMQKLIVQ